MQSGIDSLSFLIVQNSFVVAGSESSSSMKLHDCIFSFHPGYLSRSIQVVVLFLQNVSDFFSITSCKYRHK